MATAGPPDLKLFLGDGHVFHAELDEIGRRRQVLADGASSAAVFPFTLNSRIFPCSASARKACLGVQLQVKSL